jgi:hypothetical protein
MFMTPRSSTRSRSTVSVVRAAAQKITWGGAGQRETVQWVGPVHLHYLRYPRFKAHPPVLHNTRHNMCTPSTHPPC